MFYSETHQALLRFGDVLECFPSAHAVVETPAATQPGQGEFEIQLAQNLAVILTPCCEIGKSVHLTLAPLYPLSRWPYPLKNEYFREDPLRLNCRTDPERCVPHREWAMMDELERQDRLSKGPVFAFNYVFVYPNQPPVLSDAEFDFDLGDGRQTYTSKWHYVDFHDAYRVRITKERHKEFADEKKLELTVDNRNALREKLSQFYGQIPEEDRVPITATATFPSPS